MPDELPGSRVLEVVMQAPTDILNMGTRHATEVANTLTAGVTRLGAEMAKPPVPMMPEAFPALPGLPSMIPVEKEIAAPAAMRPPPITPAARLIR